MRNIQRVTARFGNMRKAQEFVVYPGFVGNGNNVLKIQSDDCIATLDTTTGVCNWVRNRGGANFIHMAIGGNIGRGTDTLSEECVQRFLAAHPRSGDRIGSGVYVA